MIPVASSAGPRATAFEAFALRAAIAADGAGPRALCEGQAPRELAWLAGGTLSPAEFALLVHAAARGRGLGRLLVQRMLDECRRALLLVRAAALPDNAAMLALARARDVRHVRPGAGARRNHAFLYK